MVSFQAKKCLQLNFYAETGCHPLSTFEPFRRLRGTVCIGIILSMAIVDILIQPGTVISAKKCTIFEDVKVH